MQEEDFALNSTGTWCVAMHRVPTIAYAPEELGQKIIFNRDAFGGLVKTLRALVDFHLLRDGAMLPVESKSINANKWKELTRAHPEHVLQVLTYWHLMQRKGLPLHDQALIAYTGKDIYRGFPIKEYPQHASRSMTRIEHLIEEAEEWAAFRADGTIPPRRCCTSDRSPKARKCGLAEVCFGEFN
jgi:hypothetical protein